MILDIYKDAFEFASRKISILFVLGVLSFFNILIIPAVFFYGYNYRVVKLSTQSMINGDEVPPAFDDLKKMFIDGLKFIFVFLCYLIVPTIIVVLSLSNGSINVILLVIGLILLLIARLFSYLAIPYMATNGDSLKSAFAVSEINKVMASIGYVRYIISYLGILLVSVTIFIVIFVMLSFVVALFDMAVPTVYGNFIGSLLMKLVLLFIVAPYLSLFQTRCAGLIYNIG